MNNSVTMLTQIRGHIELKHVYTIINLQKSSILCIGVI
jgi:hypothetical protein